MDLVDSLENIQLTCVRCGEREIPKCNVGGESEELGEGRERNEKGRECKGGRERTEMGEECKRGECMGWEGKEKGEIDGIGMADRKNKRNGWKGTEVERGERMKGRNEKEGGMCEGKQM